MDNLFNFLGKKIYRLIGMATLLFMSSSCFADTIVIQPNTIISHDVTYSNDTLDMSHGSFIIKNGATLTIANSVVNGTLSPINTVLFNVDTGHLTFTNNTFTITAFNIVPHPKTQSLQYVMQIALGSVSLDKNTFTIDKTFTAGLLITTSSIATTDFKITENRFENFHGVLYLINSDNALISKNTLVKNSYGNIVMVGNYGQIIDNTVMFSGNNMLGNSMDIMNSDHVVISHNQILVPTCHGIYVLNSHHLTIDDNRISGGITYAMNILTYPETLPEGDYLRPYLLVHKLNAGTSSDISITNNYMAQNRYGITARDVDNLAVQNNYFIQRFMTDKARQFWTDNSVLLKNITNLSWINNLYKEAFTQENDGDNSKTKKFVEFPVTGGVKL